MKQKRFAAALACLLVAFAAGCGLVSRTNTQPSDDATRQSTPAPAATTTTTTQTPPDFSQPPSQTPSPAASPAAAEGPLPAPVGFVNDYAKVIDYETRQRLEERLSRLRERGKVEFAVATVETTGGRDIFDYSLAVARGWRIGSKETGDGLLLLLAVKDRKWHIQLSRSLESVLTKEDLTRAGTSAQPLYREGKHGEGIFKCVEDLIATLARKKGFKLD